VFPDLRPRFPLFGGWKTHYLVGYNVPSYEYLFYKGKLFDTLYISMIEGGSLSNILYYVSMALSSNSHVIRRHLSE
jgi:hypothetical protein